MMPGVRCFLDVDDLEDISDLEGYVDHLLLTYSPTCFLAYLLTTYYLLLTTYYSLLTTYYLLLTTY